MTAPPGKCQDWRVDSARIGPVFRSTSSDRMILYPTLQSGVKMSEEVLPAAIPGP